MPATARPRPEGRELHTPDSEHAPEDGDGDPIDQIPRPSELEQPGTRAARAVVRRERAGRGGKEVTVVEQLGLGPSELEAWLKALKTGLGCGGVVEGDTLVLQGHHRERLVKLLAARGVKKVTIGS